MRLWHKDLIPVLPRQQLVSQWRECCCIARELAVNGTPNHLLVNKILGYPKHHFLKYAMLVAKEMERRGYKVNRQKFYRWFDVWIYDGVETCCQDGEELFKYWHNIRYLKQNYYNLMEKYDCGGIPKEEWLAVQKLVIDKIDRFL